MSYRFPPIFLSSLNSCSFARDHQLRVGQCKFADIKSRFCKLFKTWMVSLNAAHRLHVGRAIGFQQFLGLFLYCSMLGWAGSGLGAINDLPFVVTPAGSE